MNALRRFPWLRDLGAWGALALATLVVFWPLGLTNRIVAGIDAFTYFTPYWTHRMEALRAGMTPLWNPYLFTGAPFLANIQAAVLYPLHWPLSWLRPEQALVWSAILHAWLAAGFTYLLGRRSLGVSRPAAFIAGLIFGSGGFALARVENINQLNALAWLPALLLLYDATIRRSSGERWPGRAVCFLTLSIVIALQLLAGHTQTTFINMIGLGVWALVSMGWPLRPARLLPLLAAIPALALSAAQLLPTLELTALGLRTGGLEYREAVSFSLRPQLLLQSFLPPFGGGLAEAFGSEGYAEFVAYIGLAGLLLAASGGWLAVRNWRAHVPGSGARVRPIALVLAGVLLALGAYSPLTYPLWRFVPGFDLFRAPARWLELYALGAALLAALGMDALSRLGLARPALPSRLLWRVSALLAAAAMLALLLIQRWPSWPTVGLWFVVALIVAALMKWGKTPLLIAVAFLELFAASRALPFTLATAPMALSLRNAPAALLAATIDQPAAGRDRFLSLSDIRYDPGDLAELRALQADRLPADAVERLVRAAKQVEVVAPNLSLLYDLPAVDGYDGGLLPLHRYVKFQELFLRAGEMTPDGRLREQLTAIPPARLLDLTGVRFVITDKQRDLWVDDIYYDLEQGAAVQPGATLDLDLTAYPVFEADALGLIASAEPGATAGITATPVDGNAIRLTLDPATGMADPTSPVILPLAKVVTLRRLAITNTGNAQMVVQGASLINRRTGAHASITVSPEGDFRRIHSGDVKIYERRNAAGRAWIVHGVMPVASEAAAQAAVADPAFDPRSTAVIEADLPSRPAAVANNDEDVSCLAATGERMTCQVELAAPGLLVIADAWYPGWQALIDGVPGEILRANLLYRAIPLEKGTHEVTLTYEPHSWRLGVIVNLVTIAIMLVILGAAAVSRLLVFSRHRYN